MPTPDRTAASTFDRVSKDLAHAAFPEMAAAIRASTDAVLKRWRGLSLTAMPHLDELTLAEFEDTIGEILAAASEALASADPRHLRRVVEESPSHGVDRFVQKYSLLDLFEEVRILRGVVIVEVALSMGRPLEAAEAATFHAVFDIIIQQGVMTLVEMRNTQEQKLLETTREANERLIVAAATQQELAEKAEKAAAAQARLAAIVESSDDAIISKDLTGTIVTWNRGAERLFGYTAAEAVGRSIMMLIPEDRREEERMILSTISRGESVEHYDTVRRRKDGRALPISLTVSPIRDAGGKIVGASKIARDITERAAMERRIKEQADALALESRRKDEFLAMLSHELRNPLAPIRSAVHLLGMQEHTSENLVEREAREIIERQVANLTWILGDLLEVSRVVSGRVRLERQPVELNRVLRHAIETAAPLLAQRDHTHELHPCDQAGGIWVSVDPTRIEEVFINLLNNAAKYTPDGGRIEVWCESDRESGRARVRVRDNGVGIDRDLLPGIFDLFTQADRSLARSAGGLGIGLSLAHRLVELHGGTIEAHSPPEGADAGSEFVVTLPLMAAPPVASDRQTPAAAARRPEGMRVLLVDDNIDLVMMLASTLRGRGYSVRVAYTGPDGLRAALSWRPDVVLLDIGLPGMDGYEVARRLRADPALATAGEPMRLIALTGYGRDSDLATSRAAGFDGHLIKPVEFKTLETMITAPESPPRA
jgi:PAS domain S-box-containing protein